MSMETKEVTSGVVTTISDSDLVMVAGSGGWSPISFVNLAKKVRETLQMGVRNLIRCNFYDSAIPGARATNGVKIHMNSRFNFATGPIKAEGQYAVSFWAKADTPLRLMMDINDCGGPAYDIGTEWGFYTGVINVSQHIGVYGFLDIATTAVNNYKATVSDIVVVKGNIPLTDWTPAPEDLASGNWGGVNQRFTISYKLPSDEYQKGGAHDTDQGDNGGVQGCSDSFLAFGTIESLCEFIGRTCEDGSSQSHNLSVCPTLQIGSQNNEYRRGYFSRVVSDVECSRRNSSRYSHIGLRAFACVSKRKHCSADIFRAKWDCLAFQDYKRSLAFVEGFDSNFVARKEVAYDAY